MSVVSDMAWILVVDEDVKWWVFHVSSTCFCESVDADKNIARSLARMSENTLPTSHTHYQGGEQIVSDTDWLPLKSSKIA